ncbi:MAG: GNAT family N-acetyltransferase [Planctomycetota bacterium]
MDTSDILPPSGFSWRAATMDDLEACVKLFNIGDRADIGEETRSSSVTRTWWQIPNHNLATNTRVVLDGQGAIVGYVEVYDNFSMPVCVYVWGCVHPEFRGRGIGAGLLEWAEARARMAIPLCPEDTRVIMRNWCYNGDGDSDALLRKSGLELVRYSWRMEARFNGPPAEAVWPEGINVRTYEHDRDLRAAFHVDYEAFKDHWGYIEEPFEEAVEKFRHFFEESEDAEADLWFLAEEGDEVVGICLCYSRDQNKPELGYVFILAVRRGWRRRGIALNLLGHAFGEFYRRGKTGASLDVDAGSLTGATRLYEKAGMYVVRQQDIYIKELRPGKDLMTQDVET